MDPELDVDYYDALPPGPEGFLEGEIWENYYDDNIVKHVGQVIVKGEIWEKEKWRKAYCKKEDKRRKRAFKEKWNWIDRRTGANHGRWCRSTLLTWTTPLPATGRR